MELLVSFLALAAVVFAVWGLPILICVSLGRTRDRTGWMWGLFLGWLGVLILAIMRARITPAAPALRVRSGRYPAWWR